MFKTWGAAGKMTFNLIATLPIATQSAPSVSLSLASSPKACFGGSSALDCNDAQPTCLIVHLPRRRVSKSKLAPTSVICFPEFSYFL